MSLIHQFSFVLFFLRTCMTSHEGWNRTELKRGICVRMCVWVCASPTQSLFSLSASEMLHYHTRKINPAGPVWRRFTFSFLWFILTCIETNTCAHTQTHQVQEIHIYLPLWSLNLHWKIYILGIKRLAHNTQCHYCLDNLNMFQHLKTT